MAAFEYAIAAGADAIEMDVAITKDDVLVISHDPELNPEICRAPAGTPTVIRQLTFEELQRWDCGSLRNPRFPQQQAVPGARIPSLDEVLALGSRAAFLFNIELKIFGAPPERFAELLLAAVRHHKLEQRVIVQSFDFRVLRVLHGLAPEIRLSALDETGLGDFVALAHSAQAAGISPHYRLVNVAKVATAHAAGVQVMAWTANTPDVWDDLIAAGVDAIITDDPAALIANLHQKGVR